MVATALVFLTIVSWLAVYGTDRYAREADRGLDSVGTATMLHFLVFIVAVIITLYSIGHLIYLMAV